MKPAEILHSVLESDYARTHVNGLILFCIISKDNIESVKDVQDILLRLIPICYLRNIMSIFFKILRNNNINIQSFNLKAIEECILEKEKQNNDRATETIMGYEVKK